ncbi:MAG: T9SS type A sorting domain-containing protein [Saprospiraceae bacterium]
MWLHHNTLPIIFAIILTPLFAPGFILDPSNPPTGQTGAPNETTCSTASGCHSGGNYTGATTLTGLPDQILPSTAYNVSITLTSTCVKTGFELTVLDKNNAKCGTLTAGINNNVKTIGLKEYARQTNALNLSAGKATYAFKWTSPAAITGDSAFFYFVMLQANGNGSTSGDNAAMGKKVVNMTNTSAINNDLETLGVDIYPNPTSDYLNITWPNSEQADVALINSQGQHLMSFKLTKSKTLDIKNLSEGIYFLNLKSSKISFSRTISIIR